MSTEFPYITILETKYKPLELIEEKLTADAAPRPWVQRDTLPRKRLRRPPRRRAGLIDPSNPATTQDNPRTITLNPRQGVVIPKDVLHRPRAPLRTVMLMVETDTIRPTGS